jgi:hypothetical protein
LSDHCAIRAVSDPIKPTFPVSLSDRPFAIASSRSLSWGRRSRTRRLPAMTAGNWSKSVTELRTLHCVGMTAIFCSSVILPGSETQAGRRAGSFARFNAAHPIEESYLVLANALFDQL